MFKGKTVVITGGASGIGAALARGFIAEGAKVCIADLNSEAFQRVSAELGCMGKFAMFAQNRRSLIWLTRSKTSWARSISLCPTRAWRNLNLHMRRLRQTMIGN